MAAHLTAAQARRLGIDVRRPNWVAPAAYSPAMSNDPGTIADPPAEPVEDDPGTIADPPDVEINVDNGNDDTDK